MPLSSEGYPITVSAVSRSVHAKDARRMLQECDWVMMRQWERSARGDRPMNEANFEAWGAFREDLRSIASRELDTSPHDLAPPENPAIEGWGN